MPPDGTCDESPAFGRVYQSTIGQVQRLPGSRTKELRRCQGFDLAMFRSPSRSHLAVGHVHDGEGGARIPQQQGDAAGAPFHIVRVRAKEENVDGHKAMVPSKLMAKNTPRSKWTVVAYAGVLIVTAPLIDLVHYRNILNSGKLATDSDSIGLPIMQSILGLTIVLPLIAIFLMFALRRYPGRIVLTAWNRDRRVWSGTWTLVFAAVVIAEVWAAFTSLLEVAWLSALHFVLVAHLLLILRAAVVARDLSLGPADGELKVEHS